MATNLRRNSRNITIFTLIFLFSPYLALLSQTPPVSCPQNLAQLTEKLLKDLPGYANRVIQRSRLLRDSPYTSYIILAGQPEFEPLPLKSQQYQPFFADDTQQVFFTTLERHYRTRQGVTYQSYHWLFLTKIDNKWQLVKVISQLASLNEDDIPLPPKDSTDGAIGQGIRLWLRDCNVSGLKN